MATDALTKPAWVAWDEIQRDGYCVRCGDTLSAEDNESTRHATERVYAEHRVCLPDEAERKEKQVERERMREKSVHIRLVEGADDPLAKIGSAGKHVVAWASARLKSALPDREAIRSMFSLVADEKWVNHFDPVVRTKHARVLLALAEFSDFVADKYEVTAKLRSGHFDCKTPIAWREEIKEVVRKVEAQKDTRDAPQFHSQWWNGPRMIAAPGSDQCAKTKKTIIGFDEMLIPSGTEGAVTLIAPRPFLPTRIAIPKKISSLVTILGLDVGFQRTIIGPIPGDALDSLSEMGEIEMPFMQPGVCARLRVRNDSDKSVLMQASFYGGFIDE